MQALCASATLAADRPDANPLARGLSELRHYCLDALCLGTTVDEVARVPHRTFTTPSLTPKKCPQAIADDVQASMVLSEDVTADLRFRLFPGNEPLAARYLLTGIGLKRAQFASGREEGQYIERLSMPLGIEVNVVAGVRRTEMWTLQVFAPKDPKFSYVELLAIPDGALDKWLQARPGCN